jgi:hypothetical protein
VHRQALAYHPQVLPATDRLPEAERAAVLEEYAEELYNANEFSAAVRAA